MGFRPSATPVILARLKSTLLKTKLQSDNLPLYEVIIQLIESVERLQDQTTTSITTISSALPNEDYLTHTNESLALPNSRQLIAGTNITFNDTVANERTISSSGGGGGSPTDGYWVPITDGDEVNPEIIYGGGEVIVGFVPTP